jgi:hypothetical protein
MKNIFKKMLFALAVGVTSAYAANGSESEGMGLMTMLFLGFLAVIIVFQSIPAVLLFFSMLRGLFNLTSRKKALPATGSDQSQAV